MSYYIGDFMDLFNINKDDIDLLISHLSNNTDFELTIRHYTFKVSKDLINVVMVNRNRDNNDKV